jgi:hypothetical protein
MRCISLSRQNWRVRVCTHARARTHTHTHTKTLWGSCEIWGLTPENTQLWWTSLSIVCEVSLSRTKKLQLGISREAWSMTATPKYEVQRKDNDTQLLEWYMSDGNEWLPVMNSDWWWNLASPFRCGITLAAFQDMKGVPLEKGTTIISEIYTVNLWWLESPMYWAWIWKENRRCPSLPWENKTSHQSANNGSHHKNCTGLCCPIHHTAQI